MSEVELVLEPRPRTPPVAVSDQTTESNRTGSWKYIRPLYQDRVAPCAEGCPVGVDVEGYMALLGDGRTDEACDLLLRENPIPATTGRVCNHPCESRCNRGRFDGAVAIHAVERVLGDRILAGPLPEPAPRRHDESVAVVGSGPAGLACAYHLVRLGYGVEVFERAAEPGGMLRQGIPAYRLPRSVLDREIERLEALGVVFHCDAGVSALPGWIALADAHDAVFVATGAQAGRRLGVPGEEHGSVLQGLDFLRAVNRGERPALGERVVVVGGGNTAMDCARSALRLGARPVVVYRRGREEMPAIPDEVADAEREGVELVLMAAPASLETEDGRLTAVVCTPMRPGEPDASGRRRPVPTGGAPVRVPADTVILAIGEEVETDGLPAGLGGGGAIRVDAWGATGEPVFFAGGDATGEERTVARALGAGKRAAIGIDRWLRVRRGEPERAAVATLRVGAHGAPSITRWRGDDPVQRVAPANTVVAFEELSLHHFARAARNQDRHAGGGARADDFAEVNRGLAPDAALAEAGRCFQCGVCNGCELCMIFCADVAIRRSGGGGARFEISLDHCKGCGVCAAECPRGAITMTREGM